MANSENCKLKHRTVIELLSLEGNNAKQIHERMENLYGDSAPSYSTVCRWAKEFSRWRKNLKDDPRSKRPSVEDDDKNIEKIRKIVESDRRFSIRVIAE